MTHILLILLSLTWLAHPAWAEVWIDVVPFVALNTNSNQDVIGNMGGSQPKGAIVILSGGVTSGMINSHARLSIGAYDGVLQYFHAAQAENNQATTDTDNWAATGAVAAIVDIDRTIMCRMVASMVANGINLSQSTGCDQAYRGVVILFGGSDVSFKVGSFASPNSLGNSTDVATVGFEPDVVFYGKTKKSLFDDLGDPSFSQNIGIAVNHSESPDVNFGFTFMAQNGQATSASGSHVRNDSLYTIDIFSADGQIIIEGYDASGFSARNEGVRNGDEYSYAAIAIKDVSVYLGIVDTPELINQGIISYDTPVFKPAFSMFLMTGLNATNTTLTSVSASNDPSAFGVAVHDGIDTFSCSISAEDASASGDMLSLASTTDLRLLQNNGTLAWQGTLSHTASGTDINFTTNPSTPRKWLYLAIEESFVFDRPRAQPFMVQ